MKVKDLRNVCRTCYLLDSKEKDSILDFTKMTVIGIPNKYDEKEVLLIDYYEVDDLYGEGPATVLIAFVKDLNS